jgi:endonuclease/exonuclease/phosphatase family metal-dependent hydrolase
MNHFLLRSLRAVTILASFGYFVSCLTPYISPAVFWPMAFLALGYAYLGLLVLILCLVWIFIKRKVALLLVVLLLFGYKNLFATFAFNFSAKNQSVVPAKKDSTVLRVMTWNVRGFDNVSAHVDTPGSIRFRMLEYITETNPDVICMQEFAEHQGRGLISNSTELLDLGYHYFYRSDEMRNYMWYGYMHTGTVIFSKLPLLDTGKVVYNDPSSPEHILFADIKFNNRKLRIFSTHFKSLSLDAKYLPGTRKTVFHGDSNFVYNASYFEKIRTFAKEHAIESLIAKIEINRSPYPVLFTGDLNSVPASYPYHVLSKGLQDAFLNKSYGLGSTMDSLPGTLRIDYFFIDKKLSVENYYRSPLHLSDHYPQIIDVVWKND